MDELQHQEDELIEELEAQWEEGHPTLFWIEENGVTKRIMLTDVKFTDGYIQVVFSRA